MKVGASVHGYFRSLSEHSFADRQSFFVAVKEAKMSHPILFALHNDRQ